MMFKSWYIVMKCTDQRLVAYFVAMVKQAKLLIKNANLYALTFDPFQQNWFIWHVLFMQTIVQMKS